MPRLAALALVLLAACGGEPARTDSAGGRPAAGTSPAPGAVTSGAAAADTSCPAVGLWEICKVERRLREAGLVLRPDGDDPSRRDGFSVPGRRYLLGRARLELFLYPDTAGASRDFAALDTVRAAPPGDRGDWGGPPHLMRTGNLLAVLVTLNERQRERVSLAITAGLPPE